MFLFTYKFPLNLRSFKRNWTLMYNCFFEVCYFVYWIGHLLYKEIVYLLYGTNLLSFNWKTCECTFFINYTTKLRTMNLLFEGTCTFQRNLNLTNLHFLCDVLTRTLKKLCTDNLTLFVYCTYLLLSNKTLYWQTYFVHIILLCAMSTLHRTVYFNPWFPGSLS